MNGSRGGLGNRRVTNGSVVELSGSDDQAYPIVLAAHRRSRPE